MLFICQWMKFFPNTSLLFQLISLFKGSCLYISSPLKFIDYNFVAQQMVRFSKCSLRAVVFSHQQVLTAVFLLAVFSFCPCILPSPSVSFCWTLWPWTWSVLCCVWFCVLPYHVLRLCYWVHLGFIIITGPLLILFIFKPTCLTCYFSYFPFKPHLECLSCRQHYLGF